ncbi:hypothetical protein DICPUDRAFT_52531 [Dictyostelium purpureum]|uniref:EGF-like domain-containing protein n=1 Tax=Dictyostelium purpureum TaxID=5786 RepID=F0Z8R7_DICPU|nr:uncharacterized protein DICPUDRAFT_52531 [Dictyostelium purpureum]EGC39678.1 hypothetical protein DICPUDRAFT_52531 [Dictyostelium purpureum]|eukprot:XP_003283787.1 hypothetical protein DICPUDRAFT_52531 [Dictyostelium purpureum]
MKILILFFIILINVFLIKSVPVPTNLKLFSQNGHYYERFVIPETLTVAEAISNCTNIKVNNTRGYLATFTSQEEWLWATENGLTATGAWMGGTDIGQTGVWSWDENSPEKGQLMYNLYFDKCYTFCLFGNLEPNLIANEHWVHTSGSATVPYWNNNGPLAKLSSFLCEFGGLDKPFVPTSPTVGSNVTITNLGSFDISQISITFTSRSTLNNFPCTTITKIDSSSVICQIPPGQGKYIIEIKDKSGKSETIYWHYELPMIGGVNAVFKKDEVATITGSNFGTIASEISITMGSPEIKCTNVVIVKEHEVISCKLSETLGEDNKFLPISINVSQSNFVSYKAAVYFEPRYYSGFQTWATFDVSMKNYSNSLRIDGQVGYLYSMVDNNLRVFLNKTLPKPFNNNRYYFWQNAKYIGNRNFVYLTGPNAGKKCDLIYSNTVASFDAAAATWDENTRFIIYLDTLELQSSNVTGQSAVITEYGGYSPTFVSNTTHLVNTSGGKVDVKIDNYGTVYSTITVTFRGNNISFVRDYINGELDVDIPSGFDGPYEIYVNVGNLRTPSNTQFIDYAPPNIISIPSIPTVGGKVTINGESFSNTLTNTVLNFPNCQGLQILANYYSYTCTLPAGSGSIPVTLQVSQKTSKVFTFTYKSPSVDSTNSLPQTGSTLYIDGENFSTKQSNIQVKIGSKTCSNVVLETNENKINCQAPAQDPGSYDLIVTVDGLSSDPFKVKYFSSDLSYVQVGADLKIIGKDLPTGATLVLANVDISNYCTGGGTEYYCVDLPLEVKSGNLKITKGLNEYPEFPIELKPYISSISTQLLDTVTPTDIIINGRYFETSEEIPVYCKIDDTDIKDQTFILISPEQAKVTVKGGFGENHKLKIVSKNLSSNGVLFSFQPPEITEVYQDELSTLVTINGFNFSSTNSIVTFGNYKPNIKYADSYKIQFELDNENSKNGYISVDVQNQISNEMYLSIQPILSSVSPIPTLKGPTIITITGQLLFEKDFANDPVNLQFYYKLKTGQDLNEKKLTCNAIKDGTSFACEIGDGFGYFDLIAYSNQTLKSNTISSNYQAPQVLSVLTPVYYQEPTNIQIAVKYFVIEYTKVFIENVECTKASKINDTVLQCYYTASVSDQGKEALTVTVTSAQVNGSKAALIYSTLFDCIDPTCSQHGTCDNKQGKCICEEGWKGLSCQNQHLNSSSSDDNGSDGSKPVITPPVVDEDGKTEFINDKINFTVSITHLRELDYLGEPVKTLKLSDIQWSSKDNSVQNVYYYKGTFKNDTAVFELTVKYFEKENQIEFAGEPIYMPENSIKYEVTISNWTFSSPLNSLQTIYNSKTDKKSTLNCGTVESTTLVGTNQFQIQTAKGSLAARFSSRIILDDRVIKSNVFALHNNDILYTVYNNKNSSSNDFYLLTAIESPIFKDKIVLDPLFSSLINNKDDNSDGCNDRKWVVPVAVVVGAVGGLAFISAGAVFYRRKIKFSKYLKKINSVELSNK